MPELYLLNVLFGMNLVNNLSTIASKKPFLVQIRSRFIAHFSWIYDVMINLKTKNMRCDQGYKDCYCSPKQYFLTDIIKKVYSPTKYFCILMLPPFRQKKTANLHWISYWGKLFLIKDNCRYGTKLALNFKIWWQFRIKI